MTEGNYGAIESLSQLDRLVDKLGESERLIGFDVETGYQGPDRPKGSLMPHAGAFIVGFSLSVDPTWARYVPVRHDFGWNLDEDRVWEIIRPLLTRKRLVAHNAKFEQKMLRTVDIDGGLVHDTMLEAFVLSEWQSVGLKPLVKRIFDHEMREMLDLFPPMKKKDEDCIRFNVLEVSPKVVSYACEDAAWCLALHQRLGPRVEAERSLIYKVEMAIVGLMTDVEERGVEVDWDAMATARAEGEFFIEKMADEVREELGALAGRSLLTMNLNSPPQLRTLLYEELGMEASHLTEKGQPSTDALAMQALAKKRPEIRRLLQYREVQNLMKRLDLWLERKPNKPKVKGLDGRVHANYAQAVVGTGRFAASDPAIQQCPKKWRWELSDGSAYTGNFRDFLVAGEGCYLLGFDYSQIELRVLAGLSNDPALLEAFNNGDDVHALTAAMMLGKPVDQVDAEHDRPKGKTLNFALVYQMGVQGLADRLGIKFEEAQELYSAYFAGFPSVQAWVNSTKLEGGRLGYTVSKFGRKFTVWELVSDNRAVYSKGQRLLVNAPVQGGAADYVKIAMVRVQRKLQELGWWKTKVWMVMNQHDALTFEVSQELNPVEVMKVLRPAVEFEVPGFPKIVSDWEFGYTWGSSARCDEESVWERANERWRLVAGAGEREDDEDEEPITVDSGPALDPIPLTVPMEVEAPTSGNGNGNGRGKTIIVELPRQPFDDELGRFYTLVTGIAGENMIVLRLPDDDVVFDGSAIDIGDSSRLSMVLPGSRAYYPPEQVDAMKLTAGMTI